MTATLLWKWNELTATQQELLRYYSNATKDLTCHNIVPLQHKIFWGDIYSLIFFHFILIPGQRRVFQLVSNIFNYNY
jgi:hypothetical protein